MVVICWYGDESSDSIKRIISWPGEYVTVYRVCASQFHFFAEKLVW
jgi:hypothetical protein